MERNPYIVANPELFRFLREERHIHKEVLLKIDMYLDTVPERGKTGRWAAGSGTQGSLWP